MKETNVFTFLTECINAFIMCCQLHLSLNDLGFLLTTTHPPVVMVSASGLDYLHYSNKLDKDFIHQSDEKIL